MCDIRFAAAGAKFTSSFVRRGLIAEYGISWLLPRLTGTARALDVLLSGRVFLAEEAGDMGLVNRVVAPQDVVAEAQAYARDLAENCSPASMAVIKRQVYRHLDGQLAAAVEDSLRLMDQSLTTEDFREGVASYVEQRPPRFEPLSP
jgi:enoyl-CoA hydratase/carnithine racemase